MPKRRRQFEEESQYMADAVTIPEDFTLPIEGGPAQILEPPIWPELPTPDTQAIIEAGKTLSKGFEEGSKKRKENMKRKEDKQIADDIADDIGSLPF